MYNTSNTNLDFWVNLGMAIAGLFGGMMLTFGYIKKKYGEFVTKKEDPKELCISAKPDLKHSHIHEMLTSLRINMEADRVQIGQFHNGGRFLEGSPMKRFSISHESCRPGVSMEYPYLQNVLTTIFWDMIEMIKQDDPKIRLTKALVEESSLRVYNESKNIEAFILMPIKKQELYVGFIRVEWNDKNNVPSDTDDIMRLVERYRSFVELEIIRQY